MMRWRIVLFLALLTVFPVRTAMAQPSIPATFFGSVTIDGQPAPTGTDVRGFIDGLDCTQSAPGERPAIRDGNATAYVISVVHDSQRAGCGRPGVSVTFTINGEPADQRATWQPGPIQVDLSIGPGAIVPLPTATATVAGLTPTSTSPPSEPSPLGGTPLTGDIPIPGTPPPGLPGNGDNGLVTGAGTDEADGEGSSLFPVLAAALGVIAVAGAATGMALSRRRTG
jgi:hypothetical protein